MKKFWNWVQNDGGERTLRLEGIIAEETWWGDEVTPKAFRDELSAGSGDMTVWLNSPGGDVYAGAQIYNMLRDYAGKVTVKVDGLAASAASVIAMAGDEVCMSPVSMLMIHNPSTIAWGDSEAMMRAKKVLDEVKETIINAYELKTKTPRDTLAKLMDEETWMSAKKAVEMGFADSILFSETDETPQDKVTGFSFNRMAVTNSMNSLLAKFASAKPTDSTAKPKTGESPKTAPDDLVEIKPLLAEIRDSITALASVTAEKHAEPAEPTGASADILAKRLELIKNIAKI